MRETFFQQEATVPNRMTEATRLPLVGLEMSDLSALMAVIRRLSVACSITEVMEIVTPAARRLLAADGITFVLREGDLCYYAEEDAISPLWKGRRFPMSACISGWCMTERRSVAIEDIYADPRIPHEAYRPTFVRSLAMVPVRQDDPIAALGAYWRERRAISPGELELLQTIANAAALAVANIQLGEEREKAAKARRELGHRIRNLLSVVGALARQTLRSTPDAEAFGVAFSGRLQALARAQDMLAEPGHAGADIRDLVQEQVLLGEGGERILSSGPEVELAADEALDLALVLHELGTNARKYGALSSERGRVVIEWRLEDEAPEGEGAAPAALLTWTERGGPPVTPPDGRGFGSTLLRSAFRKNGGQAEVSFEAAGLVCRMRIPRR